MNELKSWYDFCYEKERTPEGSELTAIACPACGRALYKEDVNDFVAAFIYPQKHRYFCGSCHWTGYA